MANPLIVACTLDTWVKVATAVTYGIIQVTKTTTSNYLTTYRMTGDAAPTAVDDGVRLTGPKARISHSAAVDVYVMAQGSVGEVEVWL